MMMRVSTLQELDHSMIGSVLYRPHQVQAVHVQLLLPGLFPLGQGGIGLTCDDARTNSDCGADITGAAGHGGE